MRQRNVVLVFTFVFVFFGLRGISEAESFRGKCIGVTDGDTLRVDRDGTVIDVHLYGIVAPGTDDEVGMLAVETCKDLALSKTLTILVDEETEDGLSARVLLSDGTIINDRLVESGLARWDRENAPQAGDIEVLELQAKEAKVGMWQQAEAAAEETAEEAPKHQKAPADPAAGARAGESASPAGTAAPPALGTQSKPLSNPERADEQASDSSRDSSSSNAVGYLLMFASFAMALVIMFIAFVLPRIREEKELWPHEIAALAKQGRGQAAPREAYGGDGAAYADSGAGCLVDFVGIIISIVIASAIFGPVGAGPVALVYFLLVRPALRSRG